MTQVIKKDSLSHNPRNPDLDLKFFCYLIVHLKKAENTNSMFQSTLEEGCQSVLSQFNLYCYENNIFDNPVYSLPDGQKEFKMSFFFFERIIKSIVMVNYFSFFDKESETSSDISFDVEENVLYFLELFEKGENFVDKYILYHIFFHLWLNNRFHKYSEHDEVSEIYNDFIHFFHSKISFTLENSANNFTFEEKELLKQIKDKNFRYFLIPLFYLFLSQSSLIFLHSKVFIFKAFLFIRLHEGNKKKRLKDPRK